MTTIMMIYVNEDESSVSEMCSILTRRKQYHVIKQKGHVIKQKVFVFAEFLLNF